MKRGQNVWAILVLILAILLLVEQDKIWQWWEDRKLSHDPRPVVAHLTNTNNDVKYRLPETLIYRQGKEGMGLRAKDTVETGAASRAVIKFNDGLTVELQPNSLITIEDVSSGPGSLELTFLHGSVKILSQGQGSSVVLNGAFLKRTETPIPAPTEAPVDLKVLKNLSTPTPMPTPVPLKQSELEEKTEKPATTPRPRPLPKETLPDSYIASIIRNQRGFLSRCYAQHLRLDPDTRGRIDCSLTIEPDGRVSQARVIASTIPDPVLQKCIISILQRVKFKSYHGDPIIVTYPINFE